MHASKFVTKCIQLRKLAACVIFHRVNREENLVSVKADDVFF